MSLEEEDINGLGQDDEFNLEDYLRFRQQLEAEEERKKHPLEETYKWNSDDSESEEASEDEYDTTVIDRRRSRPY